MKVFFGRGRGEQTLGVIEKINKTRCKVKTLEMRGRRATARVGEVWTVPFSLISPVNDGRPAMKRREPTPAMPTEKRNDDAILADLRRVEGELSPENLTCDGELSRTAVKRKASRLNAERRRLVRELGREPTSQELWGTRW